MIRARLFSLPAFLVLALGTGGAGAVSLSGQAGLTLYDYQTQAPDTIGSPRNTSSGNLLSTQILSLDIRKVRSSGLSFHTYLRNSNRLSPSDSTGNLFRLYGAYLDYRQTGVPYSVRAGRQFLIVGIANGTMDGLKVGFGVGKRATVTGFAGLESHYDSLRLAPWKDGGMVGGEASLQLPGESFLSLSGWQLNRDSVVAKRRAGGDLHTGFLPLTEMQAHAEADLIEIRLHRFSLRAESKPHPRLAVNARFEYRQPAFRQGSIFNTFRVSANREAGAGLRLKAWTNLSLSGEAVREFFESDHADRLTFAALSGHGAITYVRRTGRSGRSWGLLLTGDHVLSERVDFGTTLDYTRYEEREDPATTDYTLTGIARLGFKVLRGFRITTDLEGLANPNYTQSTRLLVRALYDF